MFVHLQSVCDGKHVTESFVKNVPHKQCHVHEQYIEEQNNFQMTGSMLAKNKIQECCVLNEEKLDDDGNKPQKTLCMLSLQLLKLWPYKVKSLTETVSCRLRSKMMVLHMVSRVSSKWVS